MVPKQNQNCLCYAIQLNLTLNRNPLVNPLFVIFVINVIATRKKMVAITPIQNVSESDMRANIYTYIYTYILV